MHTWRHNLVGNRSLRPGVANGKVSGMAIANLFLVDFDSYERAPTLDPLTPLATQLHILNLFGGYETPYESLHAVIK